MAFFTTDGCMSVVATMAAACKVISALWLVELSQPCGQSSACTLILRAAAPLPVEQSPPPVNQHALCIGVLQEWVAAPLGENNSLGLALSLCLAVSLGCWLLYFPTDNLSHVDRWWSVGPPIYVLIFAWRDLAALAGGALGGVSPRMLVMAFLATMWGARLTYNVRARCCCPAARPHPGAGMTACMSGGAGAGAWVRACAQPVAAPPTQVHPFLLPPPPPCVQFWRRGGYSGLSSAEAEDYRW